MNFLGNLGIDIKLLIAQIINFGLLLWLLSKFLYKPIIQKIEKDEQDLQGATLKKNELDKEQGSIIQKRTSDLASAETRAKAIIAEAEEIAQKIKTESQEEAQKEKEEIIAQIKTRLVEIQNNGGKSKKQKS